MKVTGILIAAFFFGFAAGSLVTGIVVYWTDGEAVIRPMKP